MITHWLTPFDVIALGAGTLRLGPSGKGISELNDGQIF